MNIDPEEMIYAITMHSVLKAIERRVGTTNLTSEDLALAREEVKEAINHNLDEQEYIDMGLDAWEITREL